MSLAFAAGGCLGEPPPVGGGSTDAEDSTSGTETTATPDSTGGASQSQSPACIDYLACVAEAAPEQLPDAEAQYGPDGSCWSDASTAVQCDVTCREQIDVLCPIQGTGGGTGDEPLLCSIEALVPGADSPVEAGEGAEQLPIEIGALLERNCGCHYVDSAELDPEVPAYNGGLPMATWPDFHSSFMGQTVYLQVQQRSVVELSMPPPFFCDSLDFGSLDAADYMLLEAWLAAGAPDAVRWAGS